MQIVQTAKFKKVYKKLPESHRQELNKVLNVILSDPTLGEQKKGDLCWLRVYKCKIANNLTLIGYHIDDRHLVLTFVAIGSHENFYRDLKT